MLANNCFFFDNQGGFFSINDTKVSITSTKKNQKKNIRQVTVPIDYKQSPYFSSGIEEQPKHEFTKDVLHAHLACLAWVIFKRAHVSLACSTIPDEKMVTTRSLLFQHKIGRHRDSTVGQSAAFIARGPKFKLQ